MALQDLTALRAFEFCGTTTQVGLSIATPPTATDTFDWQRIHRSTLENLLQLIVAYYRRIYPMETLQVAITRILEDTNTLPPLPPEDITLGEVHTSTAVAYTAASLDIRALEQQSVDMLVAQIYLQKKLNKDEASYIHFVPYLCEHYRTPLFHTSQHDFYVLVTATFEAHPRRSKLSWESSDDLFNATLTPVLLKYS